MNLTEFWDHVAIGPGCWLWTGSRHSDGYGWPWIAGRNRLAHRVAYELAWGPLPDGLEVRHSCDTPPCVRPTHLLVGTHRQNMDDAVERRRMARGERSGMAKLADDDVAAIRAAYTGQPGEQTQLARLYGVTASQVCRIVNGRSRCR